MTSSGAVATLVGDLDDVTAVQLRVGDGRRGSRSRPTWHRSRTWRGELVVHARPPRRATRTPRGGLRADGHQLSETPWQVEDERRGPSSTGSATVVVSPAATPRRRSPTRGVELDHGAVVALEFDANSAVLVMGTPIARLQLVQVRCPSTGRRARSHTTPRCSSPITSASASSSARVGEPARHRLAVDAPCVRMQLVANPAAPDDIASRRRSHIMPSPPAWRCARMRVAHHEQPQRGVTDVRVEVEHRAAPLDRRQVLGERLEVPRDACVEVSTFMSSTFSRVARSRCAVLGPRRREREAAVARDDGRHAVEGRRASARDPRTPARRSACGCR